MRLEEPAPELQPHLAKPPSLDALEAFLAKVFLRRYVSYCASDGDTRAWRAPRGNISRLMKHCSKVSRLSPTRGATR
jgi:hypothetical protein